MCTGLGIDEMLLLRLGINGGADLERPHPIGDCINHA